MQHPAPGQCGFPKANSLAFLLLGCFALSASTGSQAQSTICILMSCLQPDGLPFLFCVCRGKGKRGYWDADLPPTLPSMITGGFEGQPGPFLRACVDKSVHPAKCLNPVSENEASAPPPTSHPCQGKIIEGLCPAPSCPLASPIHIKVTTKEPDSLPWSSGSSGVLLLVPVQPSSRKQGKRQC